MVRHASPPAVASPALEPLLTAQEARAILRCSRSFLSEHRAALGGIKVGTRLMFTRAGLADYLARQRIPEPAAEPERAVEPTRIRKYGAGPTNPITKKSWS